ncbi:MAG: phosphatidylserine decarboxylase [Gammaproteobacteria bacterium]|nr:phosphatidylserine decarboxylase [Gammaproteobacteria bacterium]
MGTQVGIALQYLLPQHTISRLVRAATRVRWRWFKNALIGAFVRGYRPELADAELTDPLAYPSFNAFFTRRLRPGARDFDHSPGCIGSPVDGTVSMAGAIRTDTLLQAKGREYTLAELLAGDDAMIARYRDGAFATIYLAPCNYHRIHMPLAGRWRAGWYVPGRLFSVNAATAARVPRLYARNERVICDFDASSGPFAVVLVGALNVGSLETAWHGEVSRHRPRGPAPLPRVAEAHRHAARGAELGCFNMGSTVILLLGSGMGAWDPQLASGRVLRAGQPIGALCTARA